MFHFIQRRYDGKSPPPELLVFAKAQTSHAVTGHVGMRLEAKIMELVLNGALWEAH